MVKIFFFTSQFLKEHKSTVKSFLTMNNSIFINVDENKKNFFINKVSFMYF